MSSIRDLQLLTLGTQLRGSRLNSLGAAAVAIVFARIRSAIAEAAIEAESRSAIHIRNAAGREVQITFSSDPDISLVEVLSAGTRQVLAIEVKGGTDVSNIHNRLGEAEKSHQKARAKGFREFWTIVNSPVDASVAAAESPSTNELFQLSRIIDPRDPEWLRLRDALTSRLGVPASG